MISLSEVYHRGQDWWPPLAFGVLCLFLALLEPFSVDWFHYQRELFNEGQIWRLITAHWVHAGNAHLWMNVVAIWLLPLVCPDRTTWRIWWLRMGFLCLMVGLGLHIFNQGLRGYVGLSGVLHGVYVVVLLHASWRGDGLAKIVLAVLVGKLVWEQYDGALGATSNLLEVPVIVDAHAYGAVAGLLLWSLESLLLRRGKSEPEVD